MTRKLLMFSLRLFFLGIVSIVISWLLLFVIDNDVFQWAMTGFLTFVLWIFVWVDSSNIGQKDVQKDKITQRKTEQDSCAPGVGEGREFKKWFGFAAGMTAQIFGYALAALLAFGFSLLIQQPWSSALPIGLKIWNMTYLQAFATFENLAVYLFILCPVLFSIVTGLGYLNGPAQQRRLETIIERNKAKKAKRVQDDLKNKKNSQKKPAIRR